MTERIIAILMLAAFWAVVRPDSWLEIGWAIIATTVLIIGVIADYILRRRRRRADRIIERLSDYGY